MTEFGRRVAENSAAGTDHGRGGVVFLLGGGVSGGKVYVERPDLAACLADPGDLPVLHNYRDVLAPIITRQAPGTDLGKVFPGHILTPMQIFG